MDIRTITTQAELEQFCNEISAAPYIAVDTEFMRERTYYAKLCLIQVACKQGEALIDPVAGTLDLTPLMQIFTNPDVVKVMHSPEQDIEILYHLTGLVPVNLFDSQIAAMALGMGDTLAYNHLVQMLLGVSLDKTQQYTDWLKRPLSEAQRVYALADVTHLLAAYPLLLQRLKDKQREHWMDEALAQLTDAKRYMPNPELSYKRVKHQLKKPEQLAVLRALASWREKRAMAKDLPRQHVVRDEVLAELAKHMPEDAESFKQIRLPRPIKDEKFIASITEIIRQAKHADPSTYPERKARPDVLPNSELVGLLSLLLKQCCRDADVAPRLIATRGDLEDVAIGNTDNACLQGWRGEIFGQVALRLIRGEVLLGLEKGRVVAVPTKP